LRGPAAPGAGRPQFGSVLARELARDEDALPPCVSIAPARILVPEAYSAGFLGAAYAPLVLAEQLTGASDEAERSLRVQDLELPGDVSGRRADARVALLRQSERDFAQRHPDAPVQSHLSAYERSVKLVRTAAGKAFDLDDEPAKVRDAYGRTLFGQG